MKIYITNGYNTTEYVPEEETTSYEEISEYLCDEKPFTFFDNRSQMLTFVNPKLCGVITLQED